METGKSQELTKFPMLPVWNENSVWHKPKLPKTLAWVAGVEWLSERFADVPQFHNLKVWFSDDPCHPCLTMTRIVAEKTPYQIFTVWYSTIGSPHWYFMVYPVETKKLRGVRGFLEEKAFPVVEQWMKKERTETWLYSEHHLHCIWNPVTEEITVQED